MSSKCRCGVTPEHVPWKCPSSVCGHCKAGGHWARYCPAKQCVVNFPTKATPVKADPREDATPVKADETSAKTPVKTPQKTPPTPEKTPSKSAEPIEQTQPAETEMVMKVESQALTQRPEVPEYARWKKSELLRECARFQLKSGTEKEMVGRLERSWETVNASPAKKPKSFLSALPFL